MYGTVPARSPQSVRVCVSFRSDGSLSGRLLHKTTDDTMEFFGPLTTVNGTVWPYLPVEPRQYRLRVLYGEFASRDEAAAAGKRLPPRYLEAFRTELRSFGELRRQI